MVVKVNVSVPEEVLQELDQAARESKTSRSALLVQAVRKYLEDRQSKLEMEKRRHAADTIRKIAEELGPWDATSNLLKWRDAH